MLSLASPLQHRNCYADLDRKLRSLVWHRNIFCVPLFLPSPMSLVAQAILPVRSEVTRGTGWLPLRALHRPSCLWSNLHAAAAYPHRQDSPQRARRATAAQCLCHKKAPRSSQVAQVLIHRPKATTAASISIACYAALCGIEIFSVCLCLCSAITRRADPSRPFVINH